MSSTKDHRISPLQSVLAGGAAGGAESLITYPTEYLKTRQQLYQGGPAKAQSPLRILSSTIRQHGVGHLYTGSMAFCVSNAAKSGVRFLAFDSVCKVIPTDSSGKRSPLGNLVAGLTAGVVESVVVVTPGETLKTKIIDDRAGPKLYRSASHAIRTILATEGLSGLYRGVLPVTLKQSSNAMVRFTSYNFFRDTIDLVSSEDSWLRGARSVVAGAGAGVTTVYATMPFDTVKTKMQALGANQKYKGTWDCIRTVVTMEGIWALWKGTTPRLVRLSISGAISFTIYEQVIKWTNSLKAGRKGTADQISV